MPGLEKLKSIFSNTEKFKKTNLTKDMGTSLANLGKVERINIKDIYLKNSSKLSETISFNSTDISTTRKLSPILSNDDIDKPSTSMVGGRHGSSIHNENHSILDDLNKMDTTDVIKIHKDSSSLISSDNSMSVIENKWFTFTRNIQKDQDGYSKLGKGEYTFSKLYTDEQRGVDNSRLNLSKGGLVIGGGRGNEPYVVSRTGGESNFLKKTESSSRSLPLGRTTKDLERLGKFMLSTDGLLFIAKQNLLGLNSKVIFRFGDKKVAGMQRYRAFYNPISTLTSATRLVGGGIPNILVERDFPFPGIPGSESILEYPLTINVPGVGLEAGDMVAETFKQPEKGLGLGFLNQGIGQVRDVGFKGDKMTLTPMIKGTVDSKTADDLTTTKIGVDIESDKNGMPFYFKDLRDDTYIIFRAQIQGITENISPTWSPENYIGRSESVYVYERADRDIAFDLLLFAQTENELDAIYKKLNRLSSMAYPEYAKDVKLNNKIRMNSDMKKSLTLLIYKGHKCI